MLQHFLRHDEEENGSCLSLEQLTEYVEDKLSPKERSEAERHLQDCPLCRDAVDGLSSYRGEQDFREMVNEVRERIRPRRRRDEEQGSLKIWYAMAAVIVLAAIGAISYVKLAQPAVNEVLFAEYFSPYPSTKPEIRQPVATSEDPLEAALSAYDRDKSPATMRLFEKVLAEEPDNITALFFVGNLYLLRNEPEPAIEALEKVASAEANQFTTSAKWYLAMAYLLNNDVADCREILSELSSSSGFYQNKARALLERLDRPDNGN